MADITASENVRRRNMATRLYREYKFKFYLNANHYIIINGKNGQTHPHTWEFVFYIMKSEGEFVLFNKFIPFFNN